MERRTPLVRLASSEIAGLLARVVPGARLIAARVLEGGAANTSYHLTLAAPAPPCVLRLYTRAPEACAKEAALAELVGLSIPVPRILGRDSLQLDGRTIPFALHEFVDGPTLAASSRRRDPSLTEAGRALGRIIGRLGRFTFERPGDLVARDGVLHVEPWPFGGDDDALGFLRFCLFDTPAGVRLGVPLRDRLWRFAAERAARWPELAAERHLVHGDFGPANLVLERDDAGWRVKAVLDWEFAHAGCSLIDVGNLLRRRAECAVPEDFPDAVRAGLEDEGVALAPDWLARARYLDVLSACDFLSSVDERPQVHARALAQIEATLDDPPS